MSYRTSAFIAVAAVLFAAAMPAAVPAAPATACENLASLALPNAKITSAQMVAQGALARPGDGPPLFAIQGGQALAASLPAFCRVSATLTPTLGLRGSYYHLVSSALRSGSAIL